MNGAAPSRPTPRQYTSRIAGHVKDSFKKPDDFFMILWICLLVTLGVDCLGALALAGGQFWMTAPHPTPFGTLAAIALLAIGIMNGWAFNSVRRATPTWARDAVIGQLLVSLLAGYVVVTDWQSPIINPYVMTTAASVLTAALLWFGLLAAKSRVQWTTKTAAIVAALFPLAGLLQFWMETYYIPSTSTPLVDISTELSPQGWTGSTIHLSAKVTIHNRGTVSVLVANTLMRVTAYPATIPPKTRIHVNPCDNTPDQNTYWCFLADGLNPSLSSNDIDFPIVRTPPASADVLYANTLGSPTYFLVAGETDTFQREVDIESKYHLARLSVSGIFLTERRIDDIRSCQANHASENANLDQFSHAVEEVQGRVQVQDQLQQVPASKSVPHFGHFFCREYAFAPADVIEKLIANHPAIKVQTWLDDPSDSTLDEYPRLYEGFGTLGTAYGAYRNRDSFDQPVIDQSLEHRVAEAYPSGVNTSEFEYALPEKPPPPPASQATAPPDGSSPGDKN
jgi:hypothetical protein